jgi:hypothetical protein
MTLEIGIIYIQEKINISITKSINAKKIPILWKYNFTQDATAFTGKDDFYAD